MEKRVSTRTIIICIALMCIIGTCMHFVCDIISSEAAVKVIGLVFPVNETTWEHMKMIWYPFLVAGIIISVIAKEKAYFGGFVISGIASMLIQLGVFALYQSFTGTSILILDIIFYMADMIICALLALLLGKRAWIGKTFYLWVVVAIGVTAAIIYLTFYPGSGFVFMDDAMLLEN